VPAARFDRVGRWHASKMMSRPSHGRGHRRVAVRS
jgi:hypothetical protein